MTGSVSGRWRISFSVLFFMAFQNGLDEIGSRRSLTKGRRTPCHPGSRPLRFHHLVFGPIASLNEDMGFQERDQFQRGGFIKDSDVVNATES